MGVKEDMEEISIVIGACMTFVSFLFALWHFFYWLIGKFSKDNDG